MRVNKRPPLVEKLMKGEGEDLITPDHVRGDIFFPDAAFYAYIQDKNIFLNILTG